MIPLNNSGILFKPTNFLSFALLNNRFVRFPMGIYVHLVSDLNAEGPPVPIPNTEVKLCSGENTCLETSRKDSSLLTHNTANRKASGKLVILTQRVHPFPFRTRKLSSAVAKILAWRRAGKIAHCQHKKQPLRVDEGLWFFRNPFNNFTRKSVIYSIPNCFE